MARKSRKHLTIDAPKPAPPVRTALPTAVYIRLSVKDRAQRGDSIEMQKRLLYEFIEENPDLELYDTYIDNGKTGTNYDRPAFQRMMADAESGKIKCIIVKDLSRLGRNAIDTGYYIETCFPPLGIRFIAVNDDYDTSNHNAGILLPLKNIINEAYAYDIGRKIKSQARQAMKDGDFIGGRPPYGYLKAPDNCHKLVVDEPAARIVRQIFQWTLEGDGLNTIVRKLNDKETPTPSRYRQEQGIIKHDNLIGKAAWQTRTVSKILACELYTGDMVQGKTQKMTGEKQQPADPSQWIRVENTHEAIVSREVFQAVQSIRQQAASKCVERPKRAWTPNIFKGKIFCAKCGGSLHREFTSGRYRFRCIANSRIAKGTCDAFSIREEALIEFLSGLLRQFADVDLGGRIQVRVATAAIGETDKAEITTIRMALNNSQRYLRSLYESLITGIISDVEYKELKGIYAEKIAVDTQRLADAEKALAKREAECTRLLDLGQVLSGLDVSSGVTHELVDKLIERIEVDSKQNIRVIFKYSDILREEVMDSESA